MTNQLLFTLLFTITNSAWSDAQYPGLQVNVKREGNQYALFASFDTHLTRCGAYNYLTDYEAAKQLPGVIKSSAYRETGNEVKVDRTVDEHVLFFHVRLRSVMEYTEMPFDRISFTQLSGDSKRFQGTWDIEPNRTGSTLKFVGLWEPDTVIPLFIIDHFAKSGLIDRFSAIAELAEERTGKPSGKCVN